MAIKKQEFYEGAALHLLARGGGITSIRYQPPFFFLNDRLLVLLKHSTKKRSPWAFTFTTDEQSVMQERGSEYAITIGLVCGADGVATFDYDSFLRVAPLSASAIHVACFRKYNEHYEISGPEGTLDRKIAPAIWRRILDL